MSEDNIDILAKISNVGNKTFENNPLKYVANFLHKNRKILYLNEELYDKYKYINLMMTSYVNMMKTRANFKYVTFYRQFIQYEYYDKFILENNYDH